MTRLLLIRHGQSEWNAQGRWQGRADPPLTDIGRTQARAAATALPSFDLLAASTLERARHTAEEIAFVLGSDPVMLHEGLVERDVGEFSGLTTQLINERFPNHLNNGQWPSGWEHDEVLVPRVRSALDAIYEHVPKGTAVIVAHGGVIYALEAYFGLGHERISNLGGRWFELDQGRLSLGRRVHLLDAAAETVADQL